MEVVKRDVSYYEQDSSYNPEAGGLRRQFAGLGELATNPLLIELIKVDFVSAPWLADHWHMPIDVGVHLIRYVARPGVPSVSSPANFHRDGEPFTSVHIVGRKDLEDGSGLTEIAEDKDGNRLLAQFELAEPFETAVVTDALVYHRVTPVVVAPGKEIGFRDVVLIDFSPMKRDTSRFVPVVE